MVFQMEHCSFPGHSCALLFLLNFCQSKEFTPLGADKSGKKLGIIAIESLKKKKPLGVRGWYW